MVYLPTRMDENYIEQRVRSEVETLRTSVEQRLTTLEGNVSSLITPTETLTASPNYLLNSAPDWSYKAWTEANVAADDIDDSNHLVYNWWRQNAVDSGQDLAASAAVISEGHSGWDTSGDSPVWDKVNARFFLGNLDGGTNQDISCPLLTDFVFPGHRYYIYFETILADSTVELGGTEFYCGFWDNSGTQQKWIEGSNFEPTYKIYGAGGTRTLKYKVLAATDGGDEILSTEITVANAPDQMSTDNHVRLFFKGAPGFLQFRVYRFDGVNYRLVGDIRNSIDLQFYDMQENGGTPETGYPELSVSRPIAKKTSVGLTGVSTDYTAHTMIVQIPTTYDRSQTDNKKQWFRFGLTGPISKKRGLGIRRLMVSEGYGPWVRSQADLTMPLSSPSSTASSAPVPGGAGGGGPSGGPDITCVTLDTLVEVVNNINGVDVVTSVPISKVQPGMNLVCGTNVAPVLKIREGLVQEVYTVYTKRGFEVTCSADHRLVTSRFDKKGTPVKKLKIGDQLLTSEEGVLAQDVISEITLHIGETPVKTVSLPPPNLFVTNGIVSHNLKAAPELEYQSI